ncbi:outer-membrane lipoprotein carrier protein LolA [Geobacter pelophilus]|jgi:outer membrane lipoprotein-sorting protein|uniref:Outer-membrane lipoprotein carrier protein LolA n=1 Tax=Geoanaerobacter pelophilus TaxID=60036 RepID=A0AAW4L7L2_9BACT|nr:outer-membrane lipoprotein carrier protein LolA [Geoanaerobacter pelophilus]MBT0664014.1 outer-membrane lipoprotein carrier protein LolA [Geoanaerobacter pelophilus]
MINFRALFLGMVLLLGCAATAFAQTPSLPRVAVSLRDVIDTVEKSFSSEADSRYSDDTIFLYDLSADFVQKTIMAGKTPKEMMADGEFLFKNADYKHRDPLKFRFEYFRPTRHEIVTDGISLWTYLPANRQVILSDMTSFFDPQYSDPTRNRGFTFLQGLPRISRDFQITYSTQGRDMNGNYILELTPRQAMETVEKLFIVVNKDAVTRYVQYNNRHIINPNNKGNRMKDYPQLAFPILSTTVIDHKGNATVMEFSNIRPNTGLGDLLFSFSIPADVQTVRPPGSTGRP